MQVNVRCGLWLPRSNLFGSAKGSTVCGCLCCTKASLFQHWDREKVSKSLMLLQAPLLPASACWLPVGSVTERAPGNTQAVWDRFSGSHQVEEGGIRQSDTGSNLVPVPGLRPLSQWPRVPTSSCHLLGARSPLWWGGVSGSRQGEASRLSQAQTAQDLAV